MKLVPIALGSESTAAEIRRFKLAQQVCASASSGKAFRHLLRGANKETHILIISDIAAALLSAGREVGDLPAVLAAPHVQAGNTSAWSKWLDDAVQWELDDGARKPFLKARELPPAPGGEGEEPLF